MARATKPNCRYCRRFNEKLFLKGRRCSSSKCPLEKRHGRSRRTRLSKISQYGLQLREKNKIKIFYGVKENQFRRYFEIAKKKRGVTGTTLLELLECRLDNIVYKLNWAESRRMARQLVVAGAIQVNRRRLNRPGYVARPGDEIRVKPESRQRTMVAQVQESRKEFPVPAWLEPDSADLVAKVVRRPTREEISVPCDEQLVVNLYSR
ncbi:MAG TPA: 30S ribosomal protein S4 [bacterium]|nr:30S ribosomal protein S4 [bacterium]HOL66420.1 30S ribosomal protein S4 [bacterium]